MLKKVIIMEETGGSLSGKLTQRELTAIPEPYTSVFREYNHFNEIQSAVFHDLFYTGRLSNFELSKVLSFYLFVV